MHEQRTSVPVTDRRLAVSNPPILAMAPLRASLAMFDEAGMEHCGEVGRLTGYLQCCSSGAAKRFQ